MRAFGLKSDTSTLDAITDAQSDRPPGIAARFSRVNMPMKSTALPDLVDPAPLPVDEPTSSRAYRHYLNMKRLLEQFCVQTLDAPEAAVILDCSITSAHRYLNTLIDAAIIDIVKREQRASKPVPKLYRLKATKGEVDRLLATLAENADPRPRAPRPTEHSATQPGKIRSQAFFLFSGPCARPGQAPHVVERDPLVAALFGPVRG